MHYAQQYIKSHLLNENMAPIQITTSTLTGQQASELSNSLKNDAINYFYSALISYVEAVKGVEKGFFSWATVKLYYCSFYALRAILAADNVCIFYVGTKGYSLMVRQGECPVKVAGTTHKLVMDLFKRKYPSSPFINQDIELMPAFEWLMHERETANYKNGRFSEPETPIIYEKCSVGLQSHIAHYIGDQGYNYCFDHEHAMLSLPLEILKHAQKVLLSNSTFRFNSKDISYLKSILRVGGHPIISFQKFIENMKIS